MVIDVDSGIMDLLLTEDEIGGSIAALTYDHDRDQLLAAISGSIYALDPETGETEFVTIGSGDGLAYGYNRVYIVCGAATPAPKSQFSTDLPIFLNLTFPFHLGTATVRVAPPLIRT